MFILSIVAVGLLWLISILHIYWAFGGRWGTEAVIPMKEGSQQAVFTPRKWGTLFVAMLLMLASGIILVQGGFIPFFQATIFSKVGSIVCALVFLYEQLVILSMLVFLKRLSILHLLKMIQNGIVLYACFLALCMCWC